MENKKGSETLDLGFIGSRNESPFDGILREPGSGLLCNLGEEFTADVYGSSSEITRFGHGGEPNVCDGIAGNDQLYKGCDPVHESLALMNDDKLEDNNVGVLGGDLEFIGNDEAWVPMEKGDVLSSHEMVENPVDEPSSPTEMEDSGNGINIFVEVFGPLDGISDTNNDLHDTGEHMSRKSDSDQELIHEESGSCPIVENVVPKNEEEALEGDKACTFDVGDLVWVKTRTQLWWPGMISDPCAAAKDETKSGKKGNFLVKYFGHANFVWCSCSELKPFVDYFEPMSRQNNSRSFFGSVEKALFEIGMRTKAIMVCPCFSKESSKHDAQLLTESKEQSAMPMDKISKMNVLSLSEFEPLNLFACVKNLACSGSVPGKIELTIMKNRLSAFYCSIGHLDLPLQLLKSSSDDEDHNNISGGLSRREKRNHGDEDKNTSSGKVFQSRERKKSRYLSYPYIAKTEQETEDAKPKSSQSTKSTPQSNCSNKNSKKKWPKNSMKGSHNVSRADNIDACSAELLTELCSTARDCFHLSRSKYSNSLKRFYVSFRTFAFQNVDTASKDAGDQPARVRKKCGPKFFTDGDKQMEENAVRKEYENLESGDGNINVKLSKIDNLQGKGGAVRNRAKKKKEQPGPAGLQPLSNCFGMGTNITTNNPCMISFQQNDSDVSNSVKATEESKLGANPGLPQMDMAAKLPDLNGNQQNLSVEDMPAGESSGNVNGIGKIVFGSVTSLKDVQLALQNMNSGGGINGIDQTCNLEIFNNGLGSQIQSSVQMGPFPSVGKLKPRKRKRKENASQTASVIPDLNGNVVDASSSVKTLPDGNNISSEATPESRKNESGSNISPEVTPQLKSRRNKSGSDVKTNRVVNKVEDPGGSLLLNFVSESILPPKETLVATFSRFGLLKESGIQVEDNSAVQIVYERSSDARFAFRSLKKNNPFGASLSGFTLHCIPESVPRPVERKRSNLHIRKPIGPVDAGKNNVVRPSPTRETTPDIAFMKKNVEMMKSSLEKAGDKLPPDLRAKLENEIKSFLDKISSMGGSSSS